MTSQMGERHPGGDAESEAAAQVAQAAEDFEQPSQEMRELFGVAFSAAEHFADMLVAEGELRGLVGPRELPRLWSRHIVNSTAVVPFLPRRGSVADVGSGAGFPGIVVALMRPDLEVTLIDTMERRVEWLELVVAELDLDNVTIRRARAEEIKDRYDAVTARAVANLSKLVRLTSGLLRPGGSLLALKGAKAQQEVDDAKYVIKKAKLEPAVIHEVVTPGEELTRVVEVRRRRG
ncbi:16S rRNA methyltransferase GidB [Actinomyces urogenitalis DSM 15434]|uniref:Ribosomal RNA small subunit methyltransferase G n=2 Tax=Actinomyces urogenitalis TaxID=103621 RepID=C0W4T7_9ACTO|nr:16S rRNA methyltransferase GidB [Actinomyces urogenitalis DSM 15434]